MDSCKCTIRGYEYIDDNDSLCTEVNGKGDVSVKIREECKYSCITTSLFTTLNTETTPLPIDQCDIQFFDYFSRRLTIYGKTRIYIKLKAVTFTWTVLVVNRKVKGEFDLASMVVLGEDFKNTCESGLERVRFWGTYLYGFYYNIPYYCMKTCSCAKADCSCATWQMRCTKYQAERITEISLGDTDWT